MVILRPVSVDRASLELITDLIVGVATPMGSPTNPSGSAAQLIAGCGARRGNEH